MRRFALAAPLLLAAACTARDDAPRPEPHARAAACTDPDLRLERADPAAAQPSIAWSAHPQRGTLGIVHVDRVEGNCPDAVEAFVMAQILLTDGRRLETGPGDGELRPSTRGSAFGPMVTREAPHPSVAGAEFVMGFVAGYRGPDDPGPHVGLWRNPDGWLVGAYSRRGGGWSAIVPLLRSSLPVRSVTYFPAPDSPAGRLGLVQEDGSGGVRLVGLDWSHRDTFR